jgi:hypothetical protein
MRHDRANAVEAFPGIFVFASPSPGKRRHSVGRQAAERHDP